MLRFTLVVITVCLVVFILRGSEGLGGVAFSVARTTDMGPPLPALVTFDHVETNEGPSLPWNSVRNEFVAPVDGTYVFTSSLRVEADALVQGRIVMVDTEGNHKFLNSFANHRSTGFGTAMVKLNAGDAVRIELSRLDVDYINCTYRRECNFNGFLAF